jgi:hypothetical protein
MQVVFPKKISSWLHGAFRREVAESNFHSTGALCHLKNAVLGKFLFLPAPYASGCFRQPSVQETTAPKSSVGFFCVQDVLKAIEEAGCPLGIYPAGAGIPRLR